jgi:opacity protein-like surface antigen
MRAAALVAAMLLAAPAAAAADPLPSGSIGMVFGGVAGTGTSAKHLGLGYLQFGGQAEYHTPMTTESRLAFSVRWQFMFGRMYSGDAARIDEVLRTLQMDLLGGVRIRPGASARRFVTLHVGGELFRANQPIPPSTSRAFAGAIGQVGVEQYVWGFLLLNAGVRYGLVGSAPKEISVLVGAQISVL